MADHNGARGISRCERPDVTESMTISRNEMHFSVLKSVWFEECLKPRRQCSDCEQTFR